MDFTPVLSLRRNPSGSWQIHYLVDISICHHEFHGMIDLVLQQQNAMQNEHFDTQGKSCIAVLCTKP